MALKKEIENDKGIVSNYHRISFVAIDIDNKKISVSIESYTKDTIRTREKENQQRLIDAEKLRAELDALVETTEGMKKEFTEKAEAIALQWRIEKEKSGKTDEELMKDFKIPEIDNVLEDKINSNVEKVKEMTDNLNKMILEEDNTVGLFVEINVVELDYDGQNISLDDIYKKLKTTDKYSDAEDI